MTPTDGTAAGDRRIVPPRKPPRPWWYWAVAAAVIAFTVYSGRRVGFSLTSLKDLPSNPLWEKFWPPEWDWVFANAIDPLIETFQIAILATLVGCLLALPVSFAMSRLTSHNSYTYFGSKAIMNLIRTIPDLFWAKLFVTAIGIGAFAGTLGLIIFSLSVMVKLFSETIDAADPGPLEAAEAAGGTHIASVKVGVLPEVLPNYVAYALYVFELNIRASVVLGLVGAGGVGRVLEAQRQFFQFDRIMGIVILLFVVVFTLEQISVAIRRRLV